MKTNNTLKDDDLFDYVDQNLDSVLETELANLQKKSFSVEDVSLESIAPKDKSTFRTKIKVTEKCTTIELLDTNYCHKLNASKSLTNSEDSEESDETEELEETMHPQTIKMYVASMLAFFSNMRIEYLSNGKVFSRRLPVFYGNREKLLTIEQHEFTELMNGNTNFLPRASLVLDSVQYDQNRQVNKNTNISSEITVNSLISANPYALVQSAPSPYNISVRLNIVTRGMTDAMMLVEQICSFFNPFYTFKLVEGDNESSVRLQLDSATFDHPELDQFSANEVTVEFGFTLYGNMFKPKHREFFAEEITVNLDL